jgi:hypothetical protein
MKLHSLKVFLKRSLPPFLVNFVLRLKWEKMKRIDLSKLQLIRGKDRVFLSDAALLEKELLPQLGLNNELLYQIPEELHPFTGKGLLHWQYPNQFSKYLALLSKLRISSYLEIGVRHGGTFVITTEYLQKFNPLEKAVGVDLGYSPSVVEYAKLNRKARFFQADTQTERFHDMVKKEGWFDLVLIDGNHEPVECRNDYLTVKDKAGVLVLHDISSVICPGVQALWKELKAQPETFTCFGFTEQYESVRERTGNSFFGIGVAVKKKYLQEKGVSLQV